jgi:hypothetical protein
MLESGNRQVPCQCTSGHNFTSAFSNLRWQKYRSKEVGFATCPTCGHQVKAVEYALGERPMVNGRHRSLGERDANARKAGKRRKKAIRLQRAAQQKHAARRGYHRTAWFANRLYVVDERGFYQELVPGIPAVPKGNGAIVSPGSRDRAFVPSDEYAKRAQSLRSMREAHLGSAFPMGTLTRYAQM